MSIHDQKADASVAAPTEQHFAELREHLNAVRPVLDEFCKSERYEIIYAGRYPRISLEKSGDINLFIDLWMSLDANGDYRNAFFEEVPYELSAGAFVVINEPPDTKVYSKILVVWDSKPFNEIEPDLLAFALSASAEVISSWTREDLLREGRCIIRPRVAVNH